MLGGGSGLGKKLVDNLCKNNTIYALINKSRIKERKNLFTFKLDLSNKISRLYTQDSKYNFWYAMWEWQIKLVLKQ